MRGARVSAAYKLHYSNLRLKNCFLFINLASRVKFLVIEFKYSRGYRCAAHSEFRLRDFKHGPAVLLTKIIFRNELALLSQKRVLSNAPPMGAY